MIDDEEEALCTELVRMLELATNPYAEAAELWRTEFRYVLRLVLRPQADDPVYFWSGEIPGLLLRQIGCGAQFGAGMFRDGVEILELDFPEPSIKSD